MTKLAANLTMMFNEVDFLDRFEAAEDAGFKGVEYLFPYPYPKDQLAERLAKHKLVQVLHNLPAGDWAKGERIPVERFSAWNSFSRVGVIQNRNPDGSEYWLIRIDADAATGIEAEDPALNYPRPPARSGWRGAQWRRRKIELIVDPTPVLA